MEGIYSWVQNIVSYLIFVTIITGLLPAGKYEKYLRLFAGCILILLVLQPLTGSLRLEEKIDTIFRSISFENEAEELRGQLDEMEKKRLNQLISRYEEAASEDLMRLASEEGFQAQSVSVSINADGSSPDFGKVNRIEMKLAPEAAGREAGAEAGQDKAGGGGQDRDKTAREKIQIEEIKPVEVRGEIKEEMADETTGTGQNHAAASGGAFNEPAGSGNAEGKAVDGRAAEAAGPARAADASELGSEASGSLGRELRKFRRTVAGYYQMEEENVEIGLED